LTGIFVAYGIGIMLFSIGFSFLWSKAHQIPLGFTEFISSFLTILFSSVVMTYLPVCFYAFSKIANPYRPSRMHVNVIFVMYSLCFLIFATVFIVNWVADKRSGIHARSVEFKF
jgi:hypothetical protein